MPAAKHDLTICVIEGCTETRMVSKKGKRLTMCHPHQKAYWAKAKTPNPKTGQRRQQKLRPEPKPAPAPKKPALPLHNGNMRIVLVDHSRDTVQRFDVPVLHTKKLSDIKHADKLLEMYRMTGHVVVEVGKEETTTES